MRRRSSRLKRALLAGARAEEGGEEDEEEEREMMETAPQASGKKPASKPLCRVFQELEERAARDSAPAEARWASSSASGSSMEWDPTAAKRACPPDPRGAQAAPAPSAQPEPGDPEPGDNLVVFHCLNCFAVLGDSVHLCREETRLLRVLVFSRITHNVILDKSLLVGIEGALLGSTYNPLFCHSCGLSVGFRLYSTYATFSDLKDLFCLFKNSIVCYLLKTKSIVHASEMEFPIKHLNDQISQLKEQIMMMDSNLTTIIRELKTVMRGPPDEELD